MINVLVIENSKADDFLNNQILTADPEINVIGVAADAEEGLLKTRLLSPDIIVMDMNIQKKNCIKITRKILHIKPVPVILIISSSDCKEIAREIRDNEVAIVDIHEKPGNYNNSEINIFSENLIQAVKKHGYKEYFNIGGII